MHSRDAEPVPASDRGLSGPPLLNVPGIAVGLEKERANPLGSYLRARRDLVTPAQAGIIPNGRRRLPGLRREELAMLAGISADYYLRLERGRDRHPSRQVLGALARALHLDDDQTAHLHVLASEPSPSDRNMATSADVPPSARALLHSLPHPAFIEDRYFTILESNEHALTLNPRLAPGRNQLRDLVLDEAEQAMHPDEDLTAACLIASLRHTIGNDVTDPRLAGLTDELHNKSERFREIWGRHEVRSQRGATLLLSHPSAGELRLNREQLAINATPHMKLVVYSPAR
ncbi:helix-turn-helix transcriptional regulator [Pseudoclavibacter helvolus]|uniref:helix-turn-helix transcriptional regulator n=1 Tax=Pseudoclavibacter helvolus TaxID=255205 RepID=UPI0009E7759C|nr:helix-turn-helix transcriptional regulator [Pseudoclavibacter helvolus]MDN5546475.1 helix-turn-helix transcriptional regulator [Rhodococcus sp. (in: high G+C Gram-positive bacteria)]